MKSRIYLFTALSCLSFLSYKAFAQDETDALRYSFLSPQGTARSIGIGGALGSIGGDFSALSVNPAGIGVYRSSDFMITPAIRINNVNGTYINQSTDDNQARFTIGNIGVVFTGTAKGKRYDRSAWKSVSFGLGINRMADFNRNTTYTGTNKGPKATSFGEAFVTDAIAHPEDIKGAYGVNTSVPAGIGWQSYLVDTFSDGTFFSPVIAATDPNRLSFNQHRTVREHGGINEIVLSLGGNYQEKFMLGATVGLPLVNYTRDMTFEESDASGIDTNYYKSLLFRESLSTSGIGVNLKLGFIYKPTDNVRLGVALHTPTYFGLTDVQNRSISTETEGMRALYGAPGTQTVLNQGSDIPEARFEYGLSTPWRAIFSASGLLGKYGFITADYEYVNYRSARFHYDAAYAFEESTVNALIKNTYKGASNIRIGAEGRLENLMIRLGFGYYGNPYATGKSTERIDVSGGIGYRFETWYLDLGFVHSQYTTEEQPYHVIYPSGEYEVPKATLKNSLNNVALTVGWKF